MNKTVCSVKALVIAMTIGMLCRGGRDADIGKNVMSVERKWLLVFFGIVALYLMRCCVNAAVLGGVR